MAVCAYVLIELSGKATKNAIKKISKIPGVKCVSAVTGPYDAIASIEAEDVKSIGDLVLSKIRAVEGVAKTMTCIVVEV